MLYLALGAAIIWLGLWVYRRSPGVQRGRWRVGAGLVSVVLVAAAGFLAARGEPIPGGLLAVVALALAMGARSQRGPRRTVRKTAGSITDAEARSLLGVAEGAGPEEIRAAYTRLMRVAHPDMGGTAGLAAQLNAARDRLLAGR